jgi:hypothetical protein
VISSALTTPTRRFRRAHACRPSGFGLSEKFVPVVQNPIAIDSFVCWPWHADVNMRNSQQQLIKRAPNTTYIYAFYCIAFQQFESC